MYGYVCIFACNENLSLWLGLVWLTPKRPQKCVHFVQRTLTRICLDLSRSGYILLLLFILFPRRKSRMFHCTSERSYCHTEMNACMHILQYTLCVKFSVKLRSVTLFWDFVEMCVTFRINWIDELLMVCERRKISKWWIPWVIQYILRVINNRIHNTFIRVTSEIRRFHWNRDSFIILQINNFTTSVSSYPLMRWWWWCCCAELYTNRYSAHSYIVTNRVCLCEWESLSFSHDYRMQFFSLFFAYMYYIRYAHIYIWILWYARVLCCFAS